MNQAKHPQVDKKSEREALRRRVTNMYRWLNQDSWEKCFSLLDPKLTEQGKVQLADYVRRMSEFKRVYGSVTRWQIKISLHLDASTSKRDKRPFAYVYVI